MKKTVLAAAAAASALLLLGACSSSTTNSSTGSSSSPGGEPAGSASSGVAAAKAFLAPFLNAPASVSVGLPPLSKRPAPGKLIIGFSTGAPTSTIETDAEAQAAALLGWKFKVLNQGFTPESEQKAMETAISLNPSGIICGGDFYYSTVSAQLKVAAAKGIPVVEQAATDPPSPTGFFDTYIAPPSTYLTEAGKVLASYVIVHSNGHANVQAFTFPIFRALTPFDQGFTSTLTKWCPQCTYHANPLQGSDIGVNAPNDIVSAVQRSPSTNYIEMDIGDLDSGVLTALKAAGLTNVNIVGHAETPGTIAETAAGQEQAWTVYPYDIASYLTVDALAREFNGDPIPKPDVPLQIITTQNVKSLVLDKQGYWLGVASYQTQFEKLWHVS